MNALSPSTLSGRTPVNSRSLGPIPPSGALEWVIDSRSYPSGHAVIPLRSAFPLVHGVVGRKLWLRHSATLVPWYTTVPADLDITPARIRSWTTCRFCTGKSPLLFRCATIRPMCVNDTRKVMSWNGTPHVVVGSCGVRDYAVGWWLHNNDFIVLFQLCMISSGGL